MLVSVEPDSCVVLSSVSSVISDFSILFSDVIVFVEPSPILVNLFNASFAFVDIELVDATLAVCAGLDDAVDCTELVPEVAVPVTVITVPLLCASVEVP